MKKNKNEKIIENKEIITRDFSNLANLKNELEREPKMIKREEFILPFLILNVQKEEDRESQKFTKHLVFNTATSEHYNDIDVIFIDHQYGRILQERDEKGKKTLLCESLDGRTGTTYGNCYICDRRKFENLATPYCRERMKLIGIIKETRQAFFLNAIGAYSVNSVKKYLSNTLLGCGYAIYKKYGVIAEWFYTTTKLSSVKQKLDGIEPFYTWQFTPVVLYPDKPNPFKFIREDSVELYELISMYKMFTETKIFESTFANDADEILMENILGSDSKPF